METLSLHQLTGQILGNYRIERFLGQGRLNTIYLARNLTEQRLDALTFYNVPERFSAEARTRFLVRFRKEASAITSLDHPHILPIYDHGEMAGNPYLVTPYMAYGSLVDLFKRHGKYAHNSILPILEQLVSGLAYAHSNGFIHGTLRPSTIVVNAENALRVAGFGLMHMLQLGGIESTEQKNTPYRHLLSIAETFLVTPEYVAPEVVQSQSIDARSDIYALGCILFELLSGQPPFRGKDPLDIMQKHLSEAAPSLHIQNPDVPIALASVVNQALERDSARRFQHVLELIEAFRQASRGAASYAMSDIKRQTKVLKNHASLQTTLRENDASTPWQLVPPIITGKHPTVQIPEQVPTSQRSDTDRWCILPPTATGQPPMVISGNIPSISSSIPQKASPPLYQEQEEISEKPTQSIDTSSWRIASLIAPDQSVIVTSGKIPNISVNTPPVEKTTSVPEQAAISEMPTQSINTGPWHAISSTTPKQSFIAATDLMPASSAYTPQVEKTPSMPVPTVYVDPPNHLSLQQQEAQFSTKQEQPAAIASTLPASDKAKSQGEDLTSLVKAYAWWSQPGIASSQEPQSKQKQPDRPEALRESLHLTNPDTVKWGEDPSIAYALATQAASAPRKIKRRKVIALLATGGAAVIVGAAILNLNKLQHLSGQPNTTKQVQPQMHMAPKDTSPMPHHTGLVLGQTTMTLNSADTFTNPANGQSSLLIHLPNDTFVAYEKACTHEQVPVAYDPATKLLVCPAHGAMFDPANGGAVVQGPATQPLPSVKVSVNADGTITPM
jgi:serine/threonine protein kinase/Rieske Fe-S protein